MHLQPRLHSSWKSLLEEEFQKPYMLELANFLKQERASFRVFPEKHLVFEALNLTPFHEVRVVIVGQDPYHGEHQAHGLSFSVPLGVKPPPSLKNIFKELAANLQIPIPQTGCLEKWARQGVLLLNTTLTVREKTPRSHHGRGWERFTDAILKLLAEKKEDLVFVLWGNDAQKKGAFLEQTPHLILKAAHPSPFSAHKFLGCEHFSKIQAHLKKKIDWSIA